MAFKHFSLAKKQAAITLSAAIMVLIFVFLIALTFNLKKTKKEYLSLSSQIVSMAKNSATINLWNFDKETASNLLDGIIKLEAVKEIKIINENGTVFAFKNKPPQSHNDLAAYLFESMVSTKEPLIFNGSNIPNEHRLGTLNIELDIAHLWGSYMDKMDDVVYVYIPFLLFLMFLVNWYFHRYFARPIIELSNDVSKVNVEERSKINLTTNPVHEADEIGTLARKFNNAYGEVNEVKNRLYQLANYDQITNLPNRTFLTEYLKNSLSSDIAYLSKITVLFMDIDNFKFINDYMGHSKGDEYLQKVATTIQEISGNGNLLVRFGGDEFVLVLEERNYSIDSVMLAKEIIAKTSQNIIFEGKNIQLSISIGIASYPNNANEFDDLIKNSDAAMYEAKGAGGNGFRIYSNALADRIKYEMELSSDMINALDDNQFKLVFQKIIDCKTLKTVKFETLIRWQRNTKLVSPEDFIPIAEKNHMIVPIGRWVLEEACRSLYKFVDEDPVNSISVNLSVVQLDYDDGFVAFAQKMFNKFSLTKGQVELEITESTFADIKSDLVFKVKELKEIGYAISIDDFGKGYSCLAYIKSLPIDTLKIDKSFIRSIPANGDLVNSIISIAKTMNFSIVAEGVENEQQLKWLQGSACELAQGYFIHKPSKITPRIEYVDQCYLQR